MDDEDEDSGSGGDEDMEDGDDEVEDEELNEDEDEEGEEGRSSKRGAKPVAMKKVGAGRCLALEKAAAHHRPTYPTAAIPVQLQHVAA
jgi:hypothetical protein